MLARYIISVIRPGCSAITSRSNTSNNSGSSGSSCSSSSSSGSSSNSYIRSDPS